MFLFAILLIVSSGLAKGQEDDAGFCTELQRMSHQYCSGHSSDLTPALVRVGKAGPRGPPGKAANVDYHAINRRIFEEISDHTRTTEGRIETCESRIAGLEKTILSLLTIDCGKVSRKNANSWDSVGGIFDIPTVTTNTEMYCDLTTDGGGWFVFQRRKDGSEDFYRNWADYVDGFGEKTGEFWLGLETLHQITSNNDYELRVDLEDWDGNRRHAKYSMFRVGDEASNYGINVSGYSGDAGDAFSGVNGNNFTTKDRDFDTWSGNCAITFKGAWWYSNCHSSNLNGYYFTDGNHESYADGIEWSSWKGQHYSMKFTEMKIKKL